MHHVCARAREGRKTVPDPQERRDRQFGPPCGEQSAVHCVETTHLGYREGTVPLMTGAVTVTCMQGSSSERTYCN